MVLLDQVSLFCCWHSPVSTLIIVSVVQNKQDLDVQLEVGNGNTSIYLCFSYVDIKHVGNCQQTYSMRQCFHNKMQPLCHFRCNQK